MMNLENKVPGRRPESPRCFSMTGSPGSVEPGKTRTGNLGLVPVLARGAVLAWPPARLSATAAIGLGWPSKCRGRRQSLAQQFPAVA